jgi:hypothetical protein
MQVTARSFAKINLGLRVGPLRPDDFHELRTVYRMIRSKAGNVMLGAKPPIGLALPTKRFRRITREIAHYDLAVSPSCDQVFRVILVQRTEIERVGVRLAIHRVRVMQLSTAVSVVIYDHRLRILNSSASRGPASRVLMKSCLGPIANISQSHRITRPGPNRAEG